MKKLPLIIILLFFMCSYLNSQTFTVKEMPDSLYDENLSHSNNDIVMDSLKNIWVAINGGLVKLDNECNILEFYSEDNSDLPHFLCQALAVDTSNHIWVGTAGGVLAEYDGCETWTSYSPYYDVTNIRVNDDNQVWFHSWNSGIAYYNRSTFYWYNTTNSDIASDNTYDLEIQDDTVVWVATMDKGLVRFCNDEFEVFDTLNSEILSNVIYGIEIDESNNIIYCGTDKGMSFYYENEWHRLEYEIFHIENCCPLLVDSNKVLWFIAEANNLDQFLFKYKDGEYIVFDENQLGSYLSVRKNKMIEISNNKLALMCSNIVIFDLVDNIQLADVNNNLNIYPNPAAKSICISGISKLLSIRIYNLKGELTYISSMVDSYRVDVDISHLGTGFFLLQIEQESGAIYQKKLIVN